MEKIKEVTGAGAGAVNDIYVHFANGRINYWDGNSVNPDKNIQFKNKKLNEKGSDYSDFSKPELEELQNILLNAYVFCYDHLDKSIESSASKQDLDELKEPIKGVRFNLRAITKYIDGYEEMLKEYEDV